MIVHRVMAEDGEEEICFARTKDNLYILELHLRLDQAGALELRDAIDVEVKR